MTSKARQHLCHKHGHERGQDASHHKINSTFQRPACSRTPLPGPVDEVGKLPFLGVQKAHRPGLLHHESFCHMVLAPVQVRPELCPSLWAPRLPAVTTQKPFSASVTSTLLQGSIQAFSSPPGPAPQQVSDLMQPHVGSPPPASPGSGQWACSHLPKCCFCHLTSSNLFMCGHLGSASQIFLQAVACTIHRGRMDMGICGLTLIFLSICELLTSWCKALSHVLRLYSCTKSHGLCP